MANLKISIHPLFFIFGLYFAFIGKVFSFLICTLVAIEHELGHYFASAKLGYKLNKITLMPYGAIIKGETYSLKYIDECKIALAGPLINAFTALIFVGAWWFVPNLYPYTDLIVFSSLTLAIINLLPCYPLDGGRFLLATLSLFLNRKKAKLIVKILGILFSLFLFIIFVISIFTKINITILFFSLFMLFGALGGSNENEYVKIYSSYSLKSLKKPKIIKNVAINGDALVKDLYQIIDNNFYYEIKVILNDKDFITLNNDEVISLLIEENIYTAIKECNKIKNYI